MGCAQSSEPKTQEGLARPKLEGSLTRQMTVGEAQDHKLKHNQLITQQLEGAAAELKLFSGKWIWNEYTDETRLLGRGAFARVFLGRQKATGRLVAIKVISKDNKFYEQQQRAMVTKVACMRALQGHRSMVKIFGVYQEPEGDHVVLEYMPARPLFDAIVEKGHFSEADAAVVMKQLLQFLVFMHDKNVVHRDIKPENLLLLKPHRSTVLAAGGDPTDDGANSDDDDEARANKLRWLTPDEEVLIDEDMWSDVPDGLRLKVIDYGTCNFCEAGQHLHSKIGTARYIAPEVLSRDYDKSSDIWSAGVVLYILLCGHAPFKGSTDTGTLAKVKTGVYSIEGVDWEHISPSAKDLLKHMMVVDPAQRWTAEDLLEHIWFQEAPTLSAHMGAGSRNSYLERLTGFAGMSRMKRLMLKLMANDETTLTTVEVARLRELFTSLDTDNDGLIDGKALHRGLAAVGCVLSERDVQVEEEFRRLDVDGDGVITAQDLVAASAAGGGVGALLGGGVAGGLSLEEAQGILEELAAPTQASDVVLQENGKDRATPPGLTFKDFRAMIQSPSALPSAMLNANASASMRRVPSALSLVPSTGSLKPPGESPTSAKAAAAAAAAAPAGFSNGLPGVDGVVTPDGPVTPARSQAHELPAAISDISRTGEIKPADIINNGPAGNVAVANGTTTTAAAAAAAAAAAVKATN